MNSVKRNRTAVELQIQCVEGKPLEELPFTAEADFDHITLQVPAYAQVALVEGYRVQPVFDGSDWSTLGVLSDTRELSFQFRLHSVVRVSAQGHTWMLRVPAVHTRPSIWNVMREWAGLTPSVGSSVIAHVAVLFAVIFLLQWSGRVIGPLTDLTVTKVEEEKPKEQPIAGGAGQIQFFPFMGMTYAEFLKSLLTPEERLQNQVANLQKNLGGLFKGRGKGVSTAALGSALGKAGFGVPGGTGPSLSARVGSQKLLVPEKSGAGNALTDADRELLRRRFRELQDDFKRIYSRLLTEDPDLSVTLSFEAVVQPSGYFSLRNIKARGKYKPAVLAKLEKGMIDTVKTVMVAPRLSGTVLRGESVFVH